MIHLPRSVILVLIALGVTGPSAMADADDTVVPPKRGVVVTATGSGEESLVCSLLFVPALEAIFDDTADPVAAVRGAIDRYTNTVFPFLAFEHGDLHQPIVVGLLWNGKDAPPSQQTTIPFQGQTLSVMVDHVDLLAQPDFQLVCEIETADAGVRRGQVLAKPGSITPHKAPGEQASFAYALSHFAARETQIDIELAYFRNQREVDGLQDPGSCPPVETEIAVVNAATLKPLADRLVVEPIEPDESSQVEVTIFAGSTTPVEDGLVPVLVAIQRRAAGAVDPDCQFVSAATARSRGITSQLEIWDWRDDVIR